MKKLQTKLLLFCIALVLPFFAYAQDEPAAEAKGHILTLFSEDGDKFFLIFEGQKINAKPSSRVSLPDVKLGYGRVKVIFDNEKIPDIGQMVQLEGVEAGWNEVTYVIRKKEKKGKGRF
jgi:hypothetical protein